MPTTPKEKRKFYQLTQQERLARLMKTPGLSESDAKILSGEAGLSAEDADHMIENVIGTFSLPLGIARYFKINGRDIPIPMVVEEPSIVAGASFMAKLALKTGGFFADATPPEMIGQIQIIDLKDPAAARLKLLAEKETLLQEAAKVDPVLLELGGGPSGSRSSINT